MVDLLPSASSCLPPGLDSGFRICGLVADPAWIGQGLIVCDEMQMKNYETLMAKCVKWLKPGMSST